MINYATWFTQNSNGKVRIDSLDIYKYLLREIVNQLDRNLSVSEIINWLKSETIQAFRELYNRTPEVGALNNTA